MSQPPLHQQHLTAESSSPSRTKLTWTTTLRRATEVEESPSYRAAFTCLGVDERYQFPVPARLEADCFTARDAC